MKNLYLVECGQATPATQEPQFDGTDNVLVLAASPDAALELARRYDRGEIEIGNWWHNGQTIAAMNEQP